MQGLVKRSHKAALRPSHLGDEFSGVVIVIGLLILHKKKKLTVVFATLGQEGSNPILTLLPLAPE